MKNRSLRRLPGAPRPPAPASVSDAHLARAVERLVAAERSRVLPSDEELGRLAEVRPIDVDRGEVLWNEAQRQAGTGLDGLLSATGLDDA